MKFLPAIRYRRNLAATYDPRTGSKLLSERLGATASTHSAEAQGTLAPSRSLTSREAA